MTPSFNQGQYIEETIRSILLQGYPELEYFVIDGGSGDESVAVIKQYANWLTGWESERDGGQTYAIMNGAARATGRIFNWINSDDRLEPGALRAVATSWHGTDMVSGAAQAISLGETRTMRSGRLNARSLIDVTTLYGFHQPSVWLDLDAFRGIGLNHNRQYGFDWELLVRYLHRWSRVVTRDEVISRFVIHGESKSGAFGIRFNADRLATARELLTDQEFHPYRLELLGRIYWEWRAVACGTGKIQDIIWLIVKNPGALLDRFVLGSIRAHILNRMGKQPAAKALKNP